MSNDHQKEDARKRQANFRARREGLPEPYPRVDRVAVREGIESRRSANARDLEWATAQDETGKFYKSECRPCKDLLAIYEGANILDKETEDEETGVSKKKSTATPKKKENRPNPSVTKIVINAVIAPDGIKIEPNSPRELRELKEVNEVVSFERWLDLRDKARKDLLWLGRLLGKGLFHSVHQYICDQFVQKNFDELYFPGYNIDDFHEAIDQQPRFANDGTTPCKELVLLESRGAYKSTINGIDAIQWLINCPDIRIMFITAFRHLAKKLAREIKRYFYLPIKGVPTAFQLLFPEYVLTGVDGRSEQPLDCPAANFNQKESNLWVTSIESSSTGDHCDLRKADDVVDPKNSADEELRSALKFEFDGTDDILDQWGFSDVTGTRYFTDDWYGTRALPNEKTKRVAPYRYSCRGCWTLPPEYLEDYNANPSRLTLSEIIDKRLGILTFPYKLSWSKLQNTLDKKGERSFKNQQLNEPTDAQSESAYINEFTEDLLRAACYPEGSIPKEGDIFQTWDTAYGGEKKSSDFSVGVCAKIYKNKDGKFALCVLEIVFDKWKSSETSFQIIHFYKKWNPIGIRIEKSLGTEWLNDNLKLTAGKYGVPDITDKIRWDAVDTTTNAKRNRIKSLEFLLADDRLNFVNGLWLEETFKQLIKFTGEKSTAYRKDDIPDALSFMLRFLPKSALLSDIDPAVSEKEDEEMKQKALMAMHYKRIFGDGTSAPPPPPPEPPAPNPWKRMMGKIFGNNGLRA